MLTTGTIACSCPPCDCNNCNMTYLQTGATVLFPVILLSIILTCIFYLPSRLRLRARARDLKEDKCITRIYKVSSIRSKSKGSELSLSSLDRDCLDTIVINLTPEESECFSVKRDVVIRISS